MRLQTKAQRRKQPIQNSDNHISDIPRHRKSKAKAEMIYSTECVSEIAHTHIDDSTNISAEESIMNVDGYVEEAHEEVNLDVVLEMDVAHGSKSKFKHGKKSKQPSAEDKPSVFAKPNTKPPSSEPQEGSGTDLEDNDVSKSSRKTPKSLYDRVLEAAAALEALSMRGRKKGAREFVGVFCVKIFTHFIEHACFYSIAAAALSEEETSAELNQSESAAVCLISEGFDKHIHNFVRLHYFYYLSLQADKEAKKRRRRAAKINSTSRKTEVAPEVFIIVRTVLRN